MDLFVLRPFEPHLGEVRCDDHCSSDVYHVARQHTYTSAATLLDTVQTTFDNPVKHRASDVVRFGIRQRMPDYWVNDLVFKK